MNISNSFTYNFAEKSKLIFFLTFLSAAAEYRNNHVKFQFEVYKSLVVLHSLVSQYGIIPSVRLLLNVLFLYSVGFPVQLFVVQIKEFSFEL